MVPTPFDAAPDRRAGRAAAIGLSVWFAAYFISFGVFLPYFPIYLNAIGLDADAIGLMMAVPLAARVVTLPLMGALADRFAGPAQAIRCYTLAAALAGVALLFAGTVWSIMAALALAAVFWTASLPVADAATVRVARDNGLVYGHLRAWGSVAFLATNVAVGLILDQAPQAIILTLFVGGLWLTVLASLPLRLPVRHTPVEPHGAWSALTELTRRPLVFVIAAAGLAQASHTLLYSFGSLYWEARGWSAGMIGALWAVSVLAEVVMFQFAGVLLQRFGPAGLIALGAGGGIVRWLAMLAEPGIAATFALQMLHGLSFGLTHLGLIHYVGDRIAPERAGAAQASATMLVSLAMASATVAAGPLYAGLGVGGFAVMAGVSLAALLLVLPQRR